MITTIPDCPITGTSAKIIKQCVMSSSSALYKSSKGYHTGVDIECSGTVYSLTYGSVIQCDREPAGYTVTIQYDATRCFQYKYLNSTAVKLNDQVDSGTKIGEVNNQVHFEYLSPTKSLWPVRIGARTYYKNDPMDILINGFAESASDYRNKLQSISTVWDLSQPTEFPSGYAMEELSNNRG